ncbi:MAG TPA: GDP-mannose 4,6-dehydratase [Candidatus Wirthbacteria bacterium]|nr:GDP-mannose 4,6-dehydratase [Candidatus Wirthbacteria bacterium]
MKKALVTGIQGQDGPYLAKHLIDQGYEVYGGYRATSNMDKIGLDFLDITDQVKMVPFNLMEYSNLWQLFNKIQPDEIYNLAAQSFVGISFKQPLLTADIDAMGPLRLLDIIKTVKPDCKFYQASTSEMFGKVHEIPQSETTPLHPRSPYGVAKVMAHWATVNYRESYDMFCCSGILFNHESPLRGTNFVTRKISQAVARIAKGSKHILELGNLDAKRDWGFAGDYVEAMYLMMQHDVSDTYVVATGETHSVREFVEGAFACVDKKIRWEGEGVDEKGYDAQTGKQLIGVNPEFFRPAEVDILIGDNTKAKTVLGWQPKIDFQGLTELMVKHDLDLIR